MRRDAARSWARSARIVAAYDAVRRLRDAGLSAIGGFHAPMERECLDLLLRGRGPTLVCLPRSVERLRERRIPLHVLDAVLTSPDQIVPAYRGLAAYQSRVQFGRQTFLIRAIVDASTEPLRVVTVYRTSKIAKYWRLS